MASLGQLSSYNNQSSTLKEYQDLINQPPEPAALPKSKSLAQDMGLEFRQGMSNVAKSAIGLGDMATGGQTTDFVKNKLGYIPQDNIDRYSSQMTPAQHLADSNMQTAMQDGVVSTLKGAANNPRAVLGSLVSSLPLMGAGVAATAAAIAGGAGGTAALGIGALAEGAMTTGIHAQEHQSKGVPYSEYAPNALGAGAITALTSIASGKLFGDAATNMLIGKGATKPLGMVKGFAVEGGEEAFQSGQEKAFENRTDKRPLMEGVAGESTFGGIVGGIMGSGMSAASRNVINPSTGKPTGKDEVVHPSTGDIVTNKDIKTAYKTYTNAFENIKDTTNEHYSSALANATALLHGVINPSGSKVANAKDVEDSKAILDLMTKAHTSLQTEESKNVIPEEAVPQPSTEPSQVDNQNSIVDTPIIPKKESILDPLVAPSNTSHLIETPVDIDNGASLVEDSEEADSSPAPIESARKITEEPSKTTQDRISSLTEEDHKSIVNEMVDSPEKSYEDIVDEHVSSKTGEAKDESVPTETPKVEEQIEQPKLPTESNTIQKDTANAPDITSEEEVSSTEGTPETSIDGDSRSNVESDAKETPKLPEPEQPKDKVVQDLVKKVEELTTKSEEIKAATPNPTSKINILAEAKRNREIKAAQNKADSAIASSTVETPTKVNVLAEAKVAKVDKEIRITKKIKENLSNQSVPAKSSPEPVAIANIQQASTLSTIVDNSPVEANTTIESNNTDVISPSSIKDSSSHLTPEEVVTKSVVSRIKSSQDKVISNEINDRPTTIKDFVEATTPDIEHTPEGLDSYISKLKTLSAIAKGNDDLSEIDASILGKEDVTREDLPRITKLYQEATAKRAELFSDPTKVKRAKTKVETPFTSSELLEDDSYSEIDFNDDFSFDTSRKATPVAPDHVMNILAINKLQRNLGKFMRNNNVKIHYQAKWMDHSFPEGVKFDKIDHRRINAWIHSNASGHNIYIHGNVFADQKSLIGTIAHELIGHFGIAQILGGDAKYKTYLNKLLNNKEILKDILALNKRWDVYLKSWNSSNDINTIDPKDIFVHNGIKIPREITIKLADEYMAELAKEKFFDNQFLERAVGLGVRTSPERSALRSMRNNILRDFIAKVRHFFKSIFGDQFDSYTYDDLVALVAKSIDNVFENINTDHISYETKQGFVKQGIPIKQVNPITGSFDISDTQPLDVQVEIPVETGLLKDIKGFVNSMESNFGNHTDTYRSKFIQNMNDKIASNPLLSSMTTFGNMPYQKSYAGVESIFKGKMAVVEKNPGAISEILNTLNPLQNQVVFEYFTTKDYDINTIPLTPAQKATIGNAKAAIREIGKSLYDLGAISKGSYEKYDDAYLHLIYLEYLNQYKGSNKTPFMGWAKKRKDLDAGAKLALGMVKDVKFLVPETLGIMSRDHTLLAMFDTISKVSTEANTHWVMKDNIPIKYLGVKLDLDSALAQLDMNKLIIERHEKIDKNTFGAEDSMIDKMKLDTKDLSDQIVNSQAQMSLELQEAFKKASEQGLTKVSSKEEFLKENYIQMPNTVKQGALRNKYVRKEIYKDLQSINSAYTFGDKSDIEKFFAEGGTMDRMNRFWKLSKVGLNPASWVRNIMGNFTLLDLSTSTNKLKLVGMLHEELSGLYSGKQSNYWRLAERHGLFGVTFSAMELQLLHNTYYKSLTDSQKAFGSRAATPHSNSLHFLDERLMHFMEMGQDKATSAISKAGISTAKLYGLMEGAFKTVSFKDYIQTWESQNNRSLDSLTEEEQLVVTTKAAAHANEAIFDYSKVPSWVRFLRTTPLGMPFLTFTYKAFPASIKAMINHPMKFAQYAALPSLLTMLAAGLNDWDDKDVRDLNSKMSDYYRHNSGVAILPWKDSAGRAQLINLDFLFPWSQHVHAIRTLTDGYHDDGALGSITASADAARVLGVLGGPLPQTITAMTTGINSFTGKPIMTPGANPTQQVTDLARYSWDLATPSWLSSTGWFSKLYNTFKDKPSVDRFGDLKTTPTQAIMDITGLAPKAISPHGKENRRLYYASKLREINTYRAHVIKDRNNIGDRANLLKDISVRLKMVRSQMSEEFR